MKSNSSHASDLRQAILKLLDAANVLATGYDYGSIIGSPEILRINLAEADYRLRMVGIMLGTVRKALPPKSKARRPKKSQAAE